MFYSIRKYTADEGVENYMIGMIEILVDKRGESLVIPHGEIAKSSSEFKQANEGRLTLGGNPSDLYLMVLHE